MICPETTIPSSGRRLLSEGNSSVIALTSGEPSGVGLEIAFEAWQKLKGAHPFFLIADRSHINSLEQTCPVIEIQSPEDCLGVFDHALPFLHYQFPTSSIPGHYNPEMLQVLLGQSRPPYNLPWIKELPEFALIQSPRRYSTMRARRIIPGILNSSLIFVGKIVQ